MAKRKSIRIKVLFHFVQAMHIHKIFPSSSLVYWWQLDRCFLV